VEELFVGESRRIVVTGAAGYCAGQLLSTFERRYDCVLLDVRDTGQGGAQVPGIELVDLLDPDLDGYRRHFAGADAVVHLAYAGGGQLEAEAYVDQRASLDMNRNVLEAARAEGVRRFVQFSSNHAADWYERLYWKKTFDRFGPEVAPFSDNFYGWSKIATEALGFVYASGRLDPALEVVMIRIGRPREADLAECGDDVREMERRLAAYLSPRDLTQLVVRSIEAPDIRNEHGVPFQVFFGISANTRAFWSLTNARRVIDYQPEDDSEVRFAEEIARYLIPAQRLAARGSETASS
jgi:nucleoside-diphosphate-sugar epimerase